MKKLIPGFLFILFCNAVFAQGLFFTDSTKITIAQGVCLRIAGNTEGNLHNANNSSFYIKGCLSVDKTINNEGEIFIDSTGTLIDNGTSLGSGNVTLKRFFPAMEVHYYTPAQAGTNINMFAPCMAYKYETTEYDWLTLQNNEQLQIMRAYSLQPFYNQTHYFTGQLNTGVYTLPVIARGDRWNLIGNPYPAYVDWDSPAWTKTGIENVIYFWNGINYSYYVGFSGDPLINNPPICVNNGSRIIPPLQGFFVRAIQETAITIRNPVKTFVDSTFFYKDKTKSDFDLCLKFNITDGDFSDEVLFLTDADFIEDQPKAYKLFSDNQDVPQIWFSPEIESEIFAIYSKNEIDATETIPIKFRGRNATEYSVHLSEFNNNQNQDVYFVDLQENVSTKINMDFSYKFNYKSSDLPTRFLLCFSDINTVENENFANYFTVFSNQNNITISCSDFSLIPYKVGIFEITGKLISRNIIINQINTMNVNNKGVYLIKITSKNDTFVKKLFVR